MPLFHPRHHRVISGLIFDAQYLFSVEKQYLMSDLIKLFKKDNPSFNERRFIDVCDGIKEK